ncbi:MAG: hypothetical protein WA760_09890 [Pseudolabrys sp.]
MSLLLLSAQSRAETACVDLAQLAHSTVGITRYFDEAARNAQSDVVGIHGTAWFQSATNVVTVGHVATAMGLSTEDWKPLDIKDGADSKLISARIQRWVDGDTEKLVVLKLQTAFPAALVSGRFVQYATDGSFAGTALLEIYEGDNRFAIDHGASGAPVFDCEGRIAAVISTVITQIFQTPFGVLRISTAWGTPNVVSVPVQKLTEFSEAR